MRRRLGCRPTGFENRAAHAVQSRLRGKSSRTFGGEWVGAPSDDCLRSDGVQLAIFARCAFLWYPTDVGHRLMMSRWRRDLTLDVSRCGHRRSLVRITEAFALERTTQWPSSPLLRNFLREYRIAAKQGRGDAFHLTTHKARSIWYRDSAAWPTLEASVQRLVSERRRVRRTLQTAPGAGTWEAVGPTNIGGRMTAIVCHPQHAEVIWAGAAGGGVWHSTDAGQTWQALWHDQESLMSVRWRSTHIIRMFSTVALVRRIIR